MAEIRWLRRGRLGLLTRLILVVCLAIPLAVPAQDDGSSDDRIQRRRPRTAGSPPPPKEPAQATTPAQSGDQPSAPAQGGGSAAPAGGAAAGTPGTPSQGTGGGRAERARPAGRPSAPSLGSVNMITDPDNLVLRLTPENELIMQDIIAFEGEEFTTDLVLTNRKGRPFDRIRVVLRYNTAFLEPVLVNDSTIAGIIDGAPEAAVDRRLGQLIYEASLTEPLGDVEKPLLFLKWRALKPTALTPLSFDSTRDGLSTELMMGEEPVLGEPHREGDGTIPIDVQILPDDPMEAQMMREDPLLFMGSDENVGGVRLALRPPREIPRVGEVFAVDVVLDNSAYSMLDGVSLLIEYDSDVLEVFDADHDNWITLGYNILDGPFHGEFPFDYHMANSVYPTRGLIEYRVGTSDPLGLLGVSGTIARILMRPKKPVPSTAVHFLFSKREGTRTTEVKYLGQDVLGDTQVKNDGTRSLEFPVLPARVQDMAAGDGQGQRSPAAR